MRHSNNGNFLVQNIKATKGFCHESLAVYNLLLQNLQLQ